MSTEDLTLQLQRLALDEYRLTRKLRAKQDEIEQLRTRINQQQQETGNVDLKINDRVRILNPSIFSTIAQGWNEQESQARITGITYNNNTPHEVVRYKLTTNNGTKTWRKPKNVVRLI